MPLDINRSNYFNRQDIHRFKKIIYDRYGKPVPNRRYGKPLPIQNTVIEEEENRFSKKDKPSPSLVERIDNWLDEGFDWIFNGLLIRYGSSLHHWLFKNYIISKFCLAILIN